MLIIIDLLLVAAVAQRYAVAAAVVLRLPLRVVQSQVYYYY
jgi:hypothetical protein